MDRHNDFEYRQNEESKGGGVFIAVVIIAVFLLLAVTVFGLTRLARAGDLRFEANVPAPTQTPTLQKPSAEAVPPYATPAVTQEDRQMPAFDGNAPAIDFVIDNLIPDIFDATAPGVVGVVQYTTQPLSGRTGLQVYGSGSGFIASSDGYIFTNAHVVDGAEKVTVRMDDGDELDAKIIGMDTETDVAVLKIDRTGLPALAMGDSDAVRVGEYVLAIGNPLYTDKLANTLTYGIISAKAREITIDSYTNSYLQTDAAINYGNSGGPLLNMKGEVIGINSAKTLLAGYDAYGNAVSAEGIGFALPINKVLEVVEDLIAHGKVDRPGIGIVISTITEAISEAEDLPVGALVNSVVQGGPAAKAGVLAGDIIVSANGTAIQTQTELVELVSDLRIGDTVSVHIYRSGEYLDIDILIENKSDLDFDTVDEN